MIDLRSDTLTVPDEAMRQAMAEARVGDDVYAEDPTINALQERVASLFGKEAALLVPSGTQGNQISLAVNARSGDEVIACNDAHIFHYENAGASVISRVQIHGLPTENGELPLNAVRAVIRPPAYYYPRTSLICVENTHNRHGGTILSYDYLKNLKALADEHGLRLHCDGARIWNAMAATSISGEDYGKLFNTMSVCLSKGLGAPVGSVILGDRATIEEARRWRKMLGGGMRQAGILAAAATYALDTILPKLAEDHLKAATFAHRIHEHPKVDLHLWRVQTNIVMFTVSVPAAGFLQELLKRDVRIAEIKPGVMRAVFHHQHAMDDARQAADAVVAVLDAA
jgi:threonine aldolase